MSNVHLYLIVGGLASVAIIFFTVMGHDLYLMSLSNDKMENDLVQHYNNTKMCPDIKYIIDGGKDYWTHGELYNKYVKLYQQNNCHEVLKK